MTRPMYESQRDRDNEQRVIDLMKERRGLVLRKMPISYRLDFMIMKDHEVLGFAELKSRNVPSTAYDTLLISLGKVAAANLLWRTSELPCYLIALFTDRCGVIDFRAPHELGLGGRVDRGDPADVEPVAHYPMSRFTWL